MTGNVGYRIYRRSRTDGGRKRSKYVGFYITEKDYESLRKHLDSQKMSMSEFCETSILNALDKAKKRKA